MKKYIETLEKHNSWRRGADVKMQIPDAIGIAIDEVLKAAKRYEEIRTWTVPKFQDIYIENCRTEIPFDDLVDREIADRDLISKAKYD